MKLKRVKTFQPIHLPNGKFEKYADAQAHHVAIEYINGLIIIIHLDSGRELAFGLAQVEYMEAAEGETFNGTIITKANLKGIGKAKEKEAPASPC